MNLIEIWAPRYRDKVVLLAKYKVGALNKVVITKSNAYNGEYQITGETVKKYPLEDNGKISCYAVPVDELERI